MGTIRHIFFDLDRTLWDFDANSKETFYEIYQLLKLNELGIKEADAFFKQYKAINIALWDSYRKGLINKDFLNVERFHRAMLAFGVDNRELARTFAQHYLSISPTKKKLFDGAKALLDYLRQKGYTLHIITNGFPEVQHIKLKNSGLETYFTKVIISEEEGYKKPAPEIFHIALQRAQAKVENSLMIGDDPAVDVEAALAVGMQAIWMNYHSKEKAPTPALTLHRLSELMQVL